uniref:Uncharacterized protein n=1 Tax=Romanomermis culicivorax TaxID=13658 RepID=A0A915KBV4_ROMCU
TWCSRPSGTVGHVLQTATRYCRPTGRVGQTIRSATRCSRPPGLQRFKKDEADHIWIKPRTMNEIRVIYKERPAEIFSLDPIFKEIIPSKREIYLHNTFGRPLNQRQNFRIDPKKTGYVPLPRSFLAKHLTLKEINHDSPSTSSSAFKFDKCRPPPAQKPAEPFISPFLITPGQNKPQMLERGSACERTFQPENSRLQQNRSSEGEPVKAPESAVTFQNIITMKVPSPDSGNNCAVGFSSAGVRTGVNTKALGHYLQGIERSNQKKVSKVKSENFYESNTSHFYAERNESLETPSSKHQQYSIEPKDVFQKIREILNSYKDQWIKINDIFNIYARIEGSPLTFSLNEGHDLHEALEKRPESFAFNKCNYI